MLTVLNTIMMNKHYKLNVIVYSQKKYKPMFEQKKNCFLVVMLSCGLRFINFLWWSIVLFLGGRSFYFLSGVFMTTHDLEHPLTRVSFR